MPIRIIFFLQKRDALKILKICYGGHFYQNVLDFILVKFLNLYYFCLLEYFRFKDESVIDLLIENGASVNHKLKNSGRTPLHQAVSSGRLKVVKSLIRAGAHINATDDELSTPLHVINAFRDSSEETDNFNSTADDFYAIAVLLIDNGADVNAKDAYRYTPLDRIENERSKFSTYLHIKRFKLAIK